MLKKVRRAIQFNQKSWLKPYINMNTKLRTEAKNDFENDFFKLMNNSVFGKKNNGESTEILLSNNRWKKKSIASEPNYHLTKYFSEKFDSNRNNKNLSWNE